MATTSPNLMDPTKCGDPFPVPTLTRTYRIYVPLLDLAVPNTDIAIAPPRGPASVLSYSGRSAALAERAADVFDGIPLNALSTARDPGWNKPILQPIEVRDAARVIRSMSVSQQRDKDIPLRMTAAHVDELIERGSTVVPRTEGGFVRLKLAADVKPPLVHRVPDLQAFLSDPGVVLPSGRRRALRLSQAAISRLVAGEPVVSGSGTGATVLMKINNESLSSSKGAPPWSPSGLRVIPPGDNSTTGATPSPSAPRPFAPPQLAMLLPLDQTWVLTTYERGRLASSISLAPQEEVTIDVYSWDRRKTSREETTTFDTEVNAEAQSIDRDTRDVFGEVTKSGNFGWGLNGSFSGWGVTVGGNIGDSATVNNVTRRTQQNFHEETAKASAKVHSSRQLKVTESTELGRESRVTRRLRNANLCHPVTFHYFELAARYRVTTRYVKEETVFVLLVDNPHARPVFDIDYVRTYESMIRRALLDPAVASGLEAARVLWSLANAAPVICNDQLCAADLSGTEGTTQFSQAVSAARDLATAVNQLRSTAATFSWTTLFFGLVPPSTPPATPGTLPADPVLALRQALFVDLLEQVAPGMLTRLATIGAPFAGGGAVTAAQLAAFNSEFALLDAAAIDSALTPDADLQERAKKLVEARVRTAYAGMAKKTLQDLTKANGTGNDLIDAHVFLWNELTQTEISATAAISNAIVGTLGLSPGFGATEANGVKQLFAATSIALGRWTSGDDDGDAAAAEARRNRQATFDAVFPAANVLAAQERFDALVLHLRANADYYANVMVTDMISRGQFPVPPELLPYAGFVALQPMTVIGGRLAYAIDLAASKQFAAALTLLQKVIDAIPGETETGEITLPTPGFIVEPKLSSCSACEGFVEDSRKIELTLKEAQADQSRSEATRRERRLALSDPNLDPFEPAPPALKINVEQTPPGE